MAPRNFLGSAWGVGKGLTENPESGGEIAASSSSLTEAVAGD